MQFSRIAAVYLLAIASLTQSSCAPSDIRFQSATNQKSGETYILQNGIPYLELKTQASIEQTAAKRLELHFRSEANESQPPLLVVEVGEAVQSHQITSESSASFIDFKDASQSGARLTLPKGSSINPLAANTYQVTIAGANDSVATLQLPNPVDYLAKPDPQASAAAIKDWYPLNSPERIPESSVWNTSSWIEAPAGKHGRISRENDRLTYNGKPIKLWGLNLTFGRCAPPKEMADKRADFYAALGINSVRLHKYVNGPGWRGIQSADSAEELDYEALDRMDYFVAALKKRGIFVKLSPVFMTWLGRGDLDAVPYMAEFGEVPTESEERLNPQHGSFYLSRDLQDLQIRQTLKLLNHTNPYTGLRYADDPAIAFFELYNEDSSLFHGTARQLQKSPTLRNRAARSFHDWLIERYGSPEATLQAWGVDSLNPDFLPKQMQDESWSAQRVHPFGDPPRFDPSALTKPGSPHRQRLFDTMEFLYDLQNDVYDRYAKAVRDSGYDGELIASNWRAGRSYSHFLNLHSDARYGTVDRHNYFGGNSRDLFYYKNASMLSQPGSGLLSTGLQQVADHPFMLSEWIHVFPSEWGAEGLAVIGAYGMGLHGWDVSYIFQNTDEARFSPKLGDHFWDAAAPQFAFLLPAVSRQVLRGDVQQSPVTYPLKVSIEKLLDGEMQFQDEATLNWDVKSYQTDVFPEEALAVARSVVDFNSGEAQPAPFDLTPHRQGDFLVSASNELRWRGGENPQDGHIEIDTPATQALVGFAHGRAAHFEQFTIESKTRFSAIYLTALSPDKDLSNDEQILLTAVARARNADAHYAHEAFVFEKGTGPVVLEPVLANIAFKREGTPIVEVLDQSGSPTGKIIKPDANGILELDTAEHETPYYLIRYKSES